MLEDTPTTRGRLKSLFNPRAAAAALFMGGDATAYLVPSAQMGKLQLPLLIVLLAAAGLYAASKTHPKALIGSGIASLGVCFTVAATADGPGATAQVIGTIPPMIKSILMMKAYYNETNVDKFYLEGRNKLARLWNTINRYPIPAGVIIESPGLAVLGAGAAASGEWGIAGAATLWLLGNVFSAASDPNFAEIKNRVVEIITAKRRAETDIPGKNL